MAQSRGPANRQPPWNPASPRDAVSFGTWLRREREARQVTLREISDVTKISIRYLEALEQDRFDILPGAVFARGFLRQYARYVGLDPDEVVNSFLAAQEGREGGDEPEPLRAPMSLSRRRREWISGLALGLVVLLLLAAVAALAFYVERSGDRDDAPPPPITTPTSAPPPPATPPPPGAAAVAPTAPLVLTLDFQGECWVEAVVDQTRRISQLHLQGESLRLEAQQQVQLTLGEPAAVRLEANGRPYDLAAYPPGRAADILIELEAVEPTPAGE